MRRDSTGSEFDTFCWYKCNSKLAHSLAVSLPSGSCFLSPDLEPSGVPNTKPLGLGSSHFLRYTAGVETVTGRGWEGVESRARPDTPSLLKGQKSKANRKTKT